MQRNDIHYSSSEPRLAEPASLLRELQQFLEATCRELDAQIREYPTPIPRCGAPFNHLYEQRSCVVRELAVLRSAPTPQLALESIAREALQHPPYGETSLEQRLRASLQVFPVLK